MGALLRGIKREQIRRGQVLAAPGTVKSAKQFLAQIYVGTHIISIVFVTNMIFTKVLTKDEGKISRPVNQSTRRLVF